MKAFVTGATGFIGSHLVDELIKRGFEVTCLVRKTSNLTWIEDLDVYRVYGDCEQESSLDGVADGFDFVFHLAGLTKAGKDEDFFCANVKGTENILKAVLARAPGIKRFVHMSSLAAAGPSRNGGPLTENSEPRPVSAYGKSKLESEAVVEKYKGKIPVTIVRPPAVYGPRDKDFFVFFKMLRKGFYPYWGKCYYSLLYVDDLVRGLITAAEAEEAEGGVFFISDGHVYSNEDLAKEISNVLSERAMKMRIPKAALALCVGIGERFAKKYSIINRDKLRELKYSHWICDSSKAEKELHFFPKVSLKEGIKWTADWYRIHQWL